MVGRCGVPSDAIAVAVTVTATQAQAAGYLTAWPAGQPLPDAPRRSTTAPSEDRANGAIVKLGTDGAIDVRASAPTQIIVDVTRMVPPSDEASAGRYVPITPSVCSTVERPSFGRPLQSQARRSRSSPLPRAYLATPSRWRSTSPRLAPTQPGYFTAFPAGHGAAGGVAAQHRSVRPDPRRGRASRRSRPAGSACTRTAAGTSSSTSPAGSPVRPRPNPPTGCSSPPTRRSAWSTPAPVIRCGRAGAIEVAVPVTGRFVDRRQHDARRRPRLGIPDRARGTQPRCRRRAPSTPAPSTRPPPTWRSCRSHRRGSRSAPSVAPTSSSTSPAGSSGVRVSPTAGEAPKNVRPPVCIADTSPDRADRVLRVRRPDHRRRLPAGISAARRSDAVDVPGRPRCDRAPVPRSPTTPG